MRRLALASFATAFFAAIAASAAEPASIPVASTETAPQPPPAPARVSNWETAGNRFFVASTVDVGYLYLRPRLSLGYGKPFTLWAGLDVNTIAQSTGVGEYGGFRVQIPWFDLRAGVRGFRSFQHNFLVPQDTYTTADLDSTVGTVAHYATFESELSGAIPAGPGSILHVLTASSIQGVPKGYYLYEETLHIIADPQYLYRVRTGYAVRLGREGNARAGVIGEVLDSPGRRAPVYRGGLVASFGISDHWEAVGLLVIPIKSPDTIGIAGGDYGELGLRWRWATDSE